MKFKKIMSLTFAILLMAVTFTGFTPQKVSADRAPVLTSLEITGYSWPELYGPERYGQYYQKKYASSVSVSGSTVYILTTQLGTSNGNYYYVDGKYVSHTIINTSYMSNPYTRIVYGYNNVDAIENLTPGKHTIEVCADSAVPTPSPHFGYPSFSDTITLNIQANNSNASSTNIINASNISKLLK
ncbi:hypothetical protein [Clostridium coskatii]|uniref:Uncharacterized protein n=1 Tax=Clostridium coskatii TaxID=1705578 RepID=A0A168M8C3_9CLOT|nr:hypothetical protein [Clostridium coskatii]OAA84355.1 hypothetical protein WX73_03495 [Clostridium coskatii]OBR94094.1 hypothetical protein CLCOS_20600 [Clostridium coskatii]